ncbi:hypothetical protein SAMN05216486_11013 [bacterium JGI 053]|nr:hypothetical protein SAMN05216486_11013 [bacterium JGI 053]
MLALSSAGAAPARMHPLHTTLTQVTYEGGAATLWVRAFADDFARGVAAHHGPAGTDPTLAYLGGSVGVWDRSGRRVGLTGCGRRVSDNLRWFCLRAPAPHGLTGMRLLVSLQFAVYDDQVNVVQVDAGGRRNSLLFVSGDTPKRLP